MINFKQLTEWFNSYDKWVNQAQRANRLGIAWTQEDKILGITYHSLEELDLKAEELRQDYLSRVRRGGKNDRT